MVMIEKPISGSLPTPEELREACHTLCGMPAPNPELATRIQYVANLLADGGPLPSSPVLVWRENDQKVHHAIIQHSFVVGRAPGSSSLAFPEDRLLSRFHFSISLTDEGCLLRNLNSKNGTAVNRAGEVVGDYLLRDGDLILAGNHIFAFLQADRDRANTKYEESS
jgi:pSer/pThr/pTyr-binding forkhead associated (FHA) protein